MVRRRKFKKEPAEEVVDESRRTIIGKIIQVKQEIDHEHNRMGAPERIPRALEVARHKKKQPVA
jgi:hypothetical protein